MHTMTHVNLDPNGSASKRIQALWNEYEQRETREAKFVKDLDLLEMALQGYEYETGVYCFSSQSSMHCKLPILCGTIDH